MAFTLILSVFSTIIDLPFTIYYTFWLEEGYGFNKQTPGFFVKDMIKKFLVGMLITLPLVAAVIYIVQKGGDYFFVYLWLFITLVLILLMTVYPDYIAPLFDKYTPLPEGELKTQIEKLAASIDFPLKKLYVVEGKQHVVQCPTGSKVVLVLQARSALLTATRIFMGSLKIRGLSCSIL